MAGVRGARGIGQTPSTDIVVHQPPSSAPMICIPIRGPLKLRDVVRTRRSTSARIVGLFVGDDPSIPGTTGVSMSLQDPEENMDFGKTKSAQGMPKRLARSQTRSTATTTPKLT